MEDFRTPAQTFFEACCACRHDHEFLYIYRVGCMCTTIQDVHHRQWQAIAVYTAQETIQWQIQCVCCCSGTCDRYCQNSVCAQIGFVFGSVCFDHSCIYRIDIQRIDAF